MRPCRSAYPYGNNNAASSVLCAPSAVQLSAYRLWPPARPMLCQTVDIAAMITSAVPANSSGPSLPILASLQRSVPDVPCSRAATHRNPNCPGWHSTAQANARRARTADGKGGFRPGFRASGRHRRGQTPPCSAGHMKSRANRTGIHTFSDDLSPDSCNRHPFSYDGESFRPTFGTDPVWSESWDIRLDRRTNIPYRLDDQLLSARSEAPHRLLWPISPRMPDSQARQGKQASASSPSAPQPWFRCEFGWSVVGTLEKQSGREGEGGTGYLTWQRS